MEPGPHRSPPAVPGGLVPIGKELEDIGIKLSHLVNFNKLVYSPFYQKILQDVVQAEGSAATWTASNKTDD